MKKTAAELNALLEDQSTALSDAELSTRHRLGAISPHSETTKQKIAASHTGQKRSAEQRLAIKIARANQIFTPETREKLSKAQLARTDRKPPKPKVKKERAKGYKRDRAIVEKAVANRDTSFMQTPEYKAKMSAAVKGKKKPHKNPMSDENKILRSEAAKGRPKSEEWKAKIRAINAAKRAAKETS